MDCGQAEPAHSSTRGVPGPLCFGNNGTLDYVVVCLECGLESVLNLCAENMF